MKLKALTALIGAGAVALLTSMPAFAGPFILAGTDADDHGFATASGNEDGWLFMQRALENLAPAVTNGNKVVVALGSNSGTQAGTAAQSAFNFSNLGAAGWTFVNINGSTAINNFFAGVGATNASNAGLIMLDSGGNVSGGLDSLEQSALSANSNAINNFLGLGGGLFSQANSYSWLNTILPGVTTPGESATGISLTAAGSAAFPGLTNGDLSAGPYHTRFEGFGAIPVLGASSSTGHAIILGAATGTITNPGVVPEPASLSLLGIGLLGFATSRRRKQKQ